ncbi:MAG: hypothetical protein ACKVOK_04270 [Flavobacteriales bacterium]
MKQQILISRVCILHFALLLAVSQQLAAQEYVEICDCDRGVKGVCREYLDSNWHIAEKNNAVWYYYNYSFGKHRFFDWSWNNSFTRKHQLIAVDTTELIQGVPKPLSGHFLWRRNNSNEIAVEQEFTNGWPTGQTKAFSKKGYLLESLDFNSPYNHGKFSMMCHWYHRGKLEVQCVFAVDMNENKEFAMDIPSQSPDPPTTLGFVPQYRRSLVLDLQGLENEFISDIHTPVLFHLLSESAYAPVAEPLQYFAGNKSDSSAKSFLSLYTDEGRFNRYMAFIPPEMKVRFDQEYHEFDVHVESAEYQILKAVKNELRQKKLRHVVLSMDTLQNTIAQFGKESEEFYSTLQYVDRCVSELMLLMRLNSRELDWNCVLITSSKSSTEEVPWILWGEGVRPNFVIDHKVNLCEARSTFSRFAHISRSEDNCLMRSCFYSEFKRRNQ